MNPSFTPTNCINAIKRPMLRAIVILVAMSGSGSASEQLTWLHPCEYRQSPTSRAVYDELKEKADSGSFIAAYELTRIARIDDSREQPNLATREAMLGKLAEAGHRGAKAKVVARIYDDGRLIRMALDGLLEADDTYVRALIDAAVDLDVDAATILMRIARGEKLYRPLRGKLVNRIDTRKWAELAGQLGSALAQAHMCSRLATGRFPEEGFDVIDSISAFAWCARATKNECDDRAPNHLAALYESGSWHGQKDSNLAAEYRAIASKRFRLLILGGKTTESTQGGATK